MPTETLSPADVLGLLKPKRSKYGVRHDAAGKVARTLDGVLYDSAAECRYAAELNIRQKAGAIDSWDRQVVKPLSVHNQLICRMVIDFRVIHNHGRTPAIEYVDVKGHVTPEWRLKAKLFEAIYGYKITEVKA